MQADLFNCDYYFNLCNLCNLWTNICERQRTIYLIALSLSRPLAPSLPRPLAPSLPRSLAPSFSPSLSL